MSVEHSAPTPPKPGESGDDFIFEDVSDLPGPSEEFKKALWEKIKRPASELPDHGTLGDLWDEENAQG